MDRKQLLKELSNYKFVPGHGPDLNRLTDEELEKRLKILKSTFEEEFKK